MGPAMRRAELSALGEQEFDLVVIGGGITGAATARDAALRGLRVLVVEKDDFASGTSSKSSKLIHGGLRYLQTYQFKLVAESLRERETALRIAPHLTELRPFLYLLYRGYPEGRARLSLGLTFYDAASGAWRKRRHHMLSAREVLEREPHLAAEGLLGAGMYYDVLTDDARLTLGTAQGAAEAGAVLINHAAVTGLVLERGRARGVVVTDQLDGSVGRVHAKQVVNATGSWTDATRSLETGAAAEHTVRPTKGVHIVVRKSDFPLNTAVFLRSPDDNRVVWPTPSLEDDVVYIGTTDTDYQGDPDDVHPDDGDTRYLLNVANAAIPEARLSERHIIGSWAGLRPLVAPAPGVSESNTSREHAITEGETGMLTISGGKLTSSRLMAEQLVDEVERKLSRPVTASRTKTTPIAGAPGAGAKGAQLAPRHGDVPDRLWSRWTRRYGSHAADVLSRWSASPANHEIIGARELTRAELRYLVEEEMACTLADVLVRRTSTFFWDRTGGLSHVDTVADELAALLGWDARRKAAEIESYARLVARHRPYELPEAQPHLRG
jgi:glycerol-3-phosphate dehydrogenase